MPQFNTCRMSRYTIGDNSNPKHNITKSMVGPWPLAPNHDYLQCIYISCIFNASVSKLGMLHSPPPSIALSSMLLQNWTKCYTSIASVFRRIEQKWMCQSHGILQLPRSLFRSVALPLHLYLPYGSVPEHCDLPVEDMHWLDLELSLGFHLNHIPIYHMVSLMYIFLKQRNMKNIMSSSASRKCKSICN